MEDDLGDVGLNALEALEAQDEQEQSTPDGEDEKDTSETGGQDTDTPEDTGENKEDETTDDSEDAGEDGEETEEDSEEGDSSEDNSDKKEEDEEMSDEEFEKLAQKRGYTKAKSEEEPKAGDDTKSDMDKLLARPDEVAEKVWDSLPEKNKVIYNSLPYIVAEGKKGTIQVKTAGQLPEDFEFRNQKAMMNFQNDLQAQEIRAEKMMEAIDAHAERERISKAQDAEAKMVIGEIEGLQKSGDLPSPKVKYGEKGFDDDPAVVTINNVLNYRAMRARQGTNLSVRDSLLIYKAEHPEEFVKKEAKGDIERKNIAKKVAGNSKATSSAVNKDDDNKPHYYKAGMTTEEVLDRVLEEMD
jgi:hypothetical protein